MTAIGTLIKSCHGLVSRSELNLEEVRSLILAGIDVHTLYLRVVDIFPGLCSTQYVINFLSLEVHLIFELLCHLEYVGACFTIESEVS